MRGAGCLLIAALTVACNGGEGESEDGSATATASTSTSTSTSAATATTSAGGSESATGSGGESDSSASTSASGSASASTSAGETSGGVTTTDTSTGDPGNSPPMFVSEPELEIVLTELYKSNFNPGEAFIASSRTDEIRVYDADTLAYITSFNHPAFSEINSPSYQYGPNGMAFNERGNLVVAAYSKFVEFSDYGVEYATYPKVAPEATENVIFDALGNLYTTTSTGGTDKLNQYRAEDYAFEQTIDVPPGAGSLTGITFDGYGRLYLASQSDNTIHVTDINFDFKTFTWMEKLSGAGNPGNFEGLQFNANGQLVAAAGDLILYDVFSKMKVGTFDAPNDAFPVPLRVDNDGNIYTADYENGTGTAPADIFRFTPDGKEFITSNDPGLFGPFGLVISGTVLAGDPPVLWTYVLEAVDADGDTLTYTLVSGPLGMYLDQQTHTLTWAVTSEDIGEHMVSVKVEDGKGGEDVQDFVLVIKSI
ncbi:MAG: hypothetical protein H6711_32895 [Myxococcales bacterium]|nr:hypothetical protein [Myxococcales bacterium]